MPMHNSEKLFDDCVRAAGGRRVSELVGASPEFDNADFVFEQENVVAEAKSLQKDFANDPAIEHKMHLLFNEWVNAGKVPPGYGRVAVNTGQLPLECSREIINLFKEPFGQRLKQANRQIKQIRERLDRPQALGLLLLSNDGNLALDPYMTAHLLHHLLKVKFSAIDHVIYVSPTLTIRLPGSPQDVLPFISISFPNRRSPDEAFVEKLKASWFHALEAATGEAYPDLGWRESGPGDIHDARFQRPSNSPDPL